MTQRDKEELERLRHKEEHDALVDGLVEYSEEQFGPARDDLTKRLSDKQRRVFRLKLTGVMAALLGTILTISGRLLSALHFVYKLLRFLMQ